MPQNEDRINKVFDHWIRRWRNFTGTVVKQSDLRQLSKTELFLKGNNKINIYKTNSPFNTVTASTEIKTLSSIISVLIIFSLVNESTI
ncbi:MULTISPECIES: hypothetical protein [Flavobacterium]|uniref:hypothetical protein n=1 Tax=Flavobacterium TaxID=237 RepID=UPI00188A0709|nr:MULTISPECIES: hypothetical protein [Flavobacterium]MBF4469784.1 hypothetical protein [Flavobacterium sp. HJJ]